MRPQPPGGTIRVLLTHPHFWPYVRRGAEREVHDLAVRLTGRGHRVRVLAGAPEGLVRRARIDGVPVRYVRTALPAWARRRGFGPETAFAPAAALGTLASRAELVTAFHYADAYGALRTRRGRPVVLKLTGTVLPERMREVRIDRRMFAEAVHGAAEVWCNSAYARDVMAGFGRDMAVVPAGVDLDRFRPAAPRADRPTVLCTAAPDEPRKRLVDLVDAWPTVHADLPDALLVIAGRTGAEVRDELLERLPPAVRSSVRLPGDLRDDALVDAYSAAHVCVAPAVYEALGLATLESLACGTPVVGARSGATAELVHDGVGALFEPGQPQDCARALLAVLATTGTDDAARRARCRAAAAPYDWAVVTDEVERRYRALLH